MLWMQVLQWMNFLVTPPLPQIEDKLWGLRDARDVDDLIGRIRDCAPDISNITQLATLRQNVRSL